MINGGRGPTYHNTAYHMNTYMASKADSQQQLAAERGREKRETRETRQEKNAKNREILIVLLIGVNVREVMMRLV